MMNCPTYGTVECAAGCCFVCGGQGDESPLRCPPPSEVIRIDCVYGWKGDPGDPELVRRATTLGTMTILKPEKDVRTVETSAYEALKALHDRVCACDDPGRLGYCSFDEFTALDPGKAKAG